MNDSNVVFMRPDILTRGGTYFDFVTPRKSVITIEDIAHGLSNVCRFAGHTKVFYSVAQHCYHVSYLVPPEYAFEGLMHDAHEAYVGDMPTPLKRLLPEYAEIEHRAEDAVLAAFGLERPLHRSVKKADLIMLATEQRDLLPPHDDEWALLRGVEPLKDEIHPWSPADACRYFLARFHELTTKEGT
jgi:5'-deoxynucleotidase YfbR-like HD superfamily hydrolase